eukprot:12685972-Prorocentrum_lima.AAC.1
MGAQPGSEREAGPGMSSSSSSKGVVGSGMETKEGSWRGAGREGTWRGRRQGPRQAGGRAGMSARADRRVCLTT